MYKQIFMLLFLGITTLASAQITLSGRIANLTYQPTNQLVFEFWSVDHWQQFELTSVAPDGTFSKVAAAPPIGQCRLRITNQPRNWLDFIVPDSTQHEKELRFDLDINQMNGGTARLPESPENELYYGLITAYRSMSALRDSNVLSHSERVDALVADFNKLCKETSLHHRGTYTGDIVANLLYQPRPQDYPHKPAAATLSANEFARAYLLDKVPFRYAGILHHTAFIKSLHRYYTFFQNTEGGGQAYVDGIMSRRNGNDEVDGFAFRFLLEKMMDFKDEGGLTYLLNWYLPDCTDESPLPNATQALLEALKTCAPGRQVPDLSLPALNGQPVQLSQVCAANKLTLLLFWRSTCSHCLEFEPELERIYEKYHPLGVEVYALSSDKFEQDWKDFLVKNPTKWVNVYIPAEQRRQIGRSFPAPSTPTLIALDRNRKVLSRLVPRTQLEAYLDEALKQVGSVK